jgi:RNA polymerase sigma factor (sigma-70 family)
MQWVTTSKILRDLKDFENAAAWAGFVGRFHGPIAGFARSMGVAPLDAEDVAQETLSAFAQAYRAGAYDPGRGRLSSWLFGIAHNQILRQRRRDARPDRPLPTRDEGPEFWEDLPDEKAATRHWDRHWERFVIADCLRRVREEFPADSYRAFAMIVEESLSPAEAARALGVPVRFVYNAKHRILRRVRELRAEIEEDAPGHGLP